MKGSQEYEELHISTVTSKNVLTDAGDNIIGGLFVGIAFVAITGVLFSWISSSTTLFDDNAIMVVVQQILIGAFFIFILAILANYRVLKTLQRHAYAMLRAAFFIQVGLLVGFLIIIGLISIQTTFGLILLVIGLGLAALFYFLWPRIRARLMVSAEWLKVAAGIVLAEPGMIFLSIIQSLIIGIAVITEFIVFYAFSAYATTAALDADLAGAIQYIIGFIYLVFSFFVIYFFDGANTIMAYARIKGTDPTIGQGINGASKKMVSILGFAIITSIVKTVAMALRNMSREMRGNRRDMRAVIFAGIMNFMVSMAEWVYHLISFFTLPIIVIRGKNTMESMRESYQLFSRNAWNVIFSDMGYSFGAMIMYLLTGIILAVGGFAYGYFVGAAAGLGTTASGAGILVGILALLFGLAITKFFLRPLYTSFVTTIYVYASEGPEGLKIVSNKLKKQINTSLHSPKARPRTTRRF